MEKIENVLIVSMEISVNISNVPESMSNEELINIALIECNKYNEENGMDYYADKLTEIDIFKTKQEIEAYWNTFNDYEDFEKVADCNLVLE